MADVGEGPFRFSWPVPAHVRVNETVERDGQTEELQYQANLVAGRGDTLELRFSGLQLVEPPAGGEPPADSRSALGFFDMVLPTLVLSRDGELREIGGLEGALDIALALRLGISNPLVKAARSGLRSPEVTADIKRKRSAVWDLWVGDWVGLELRAGQESVADVSVEMPGGTSLTMPTRIRHMGPHPALKGHVRFSVEGLVEGPSFVAALIASRKAPPDQAWAAEGRVTPDKIVDMRMETRQSLVTEASTLRPREARSEFSVTVSLKGEAPRTQLERRVYRFEWSDGPPQQH